MAFEILGEISQVETFATGSGIREIALCEKSTDAAVGANERGSLAFGC